MQPGRWPKVEAISKTKVLPQLFVKAEVKAEVKVEILWLHEGGAVGPVFRAPPGIRGERRVVAPSHPCR